MPRTTSAKAGDILNGTYGYATFNGKDLYEVSKFEIKLNTNREDVNFAGKMMSDSKLVGLSGTYTMTLKKVYSYAKDYVKDFLNGKDPRNTFIGKLADPGSEGTEAVQITNCWLNDPTVLSYESAKTIEEEVSGGFTGLDYLDSIDDPWE